MQLLEPIVALVGPRHHILTVVTLLRHKKEPDDIIDVRLAHINRIQTHLVEINLLGHKTYVGFLATQGQFFVGETKFNSPGPKIY